MLFGKISEAVVKIRQRDELVTVLIFIKGAPISRMKCLAKADGELFIGDITPFTKKKYYNKKYGSQMMCELISYAKEKGFKVITGNLNGVGCDSLDRLHAFYKKFDFEIIETQDPDSSFYAKIRKVL